MIRFHAHRVEPGVLQDVLEQHALRAGRDVGRHLVLDVVPRLLDVVVLVALRPGLAAVERVLEADLGTWGCARTCGALRDPGDVVGRVDLEDDVPFAALLVGVHHGVPAFVLLLGLDVDRFDRHRLVLVVLQLRPEDDRAGLLAGADVDGVLAEVELRLGLGVDLRDRFELDVLARRALCTSTSYAPLTSSISFTSTLVRPDGLGTSVQVMPLSVLIAMRGRRESAVIFMLVMTLAPSTL